MMTKIIQASIVVAILSLTSMAQAPGRDARKTAVVVPADVGLAVVVSQPESPLKIEEAEILRYFSGGYGPSYRLRNSGRKTIVAYTIAKWNSNNSGSVIDWHTTDHEPPLLPGKSEKESSNVRIVQLRDDLRTEFDLRPPLRAITFFLIVKVSFSDGTKFDASATFAALRTHLESFDSVYERLKR